MIPTSLITLKTKTHSLPPLLQKWIPVITKVIVLISKSSEETENSSLASTDSKIQSNQNPHRMYLPCQHHQFHHQS